MSLDFRLSYNTGYDYTDLLPYTSIEAIKDIENILNYSTMDLSIPAYDGELQEISAVLTDKQKVAPFSVDLIDDGLEALRAYCTIDQIESTDTGFKIIRLNKGSTTPINVRLRFREGGL